MIYVWNTETKDILACLTGFHQKAVKHVFFMLSLIISYDFLQLVRNYCLLGKMNTIHLHYMIG